MRRSVKAEVLEEAGRLGASPADLEGISLAWSEIDFRDEVYGASVLPDPNEASDEEYVLAAAIANVRQRRGAELESARPVVEKVEIVRQKRLQGAEKSRQKRAKKALHREKRLARWIDKQPGPTTAGKLLRRLMLEGVVGDEHRIEALGGKKKPVPSRDTIERLLREKAGE